MKPYKEEKHVLKKEVCLSLLLLFLSFFNSSAQIPINGFCSLSQISVSPNYLSFCALDYSNDGYRDLVLYNNSKNKITTITSVNRAQFGKPIERHSPFNISLLKSFVYDNKSKNVLAVSKNSKEAGVATFSKSGSFSIMNKLKLNGSPSSQDVGKILESNYPVIMYAGAGVDGLVLTKIQNRKLNEVERIKGKIFASAVFLDLNYDGYQDIAAVDLLSNSIIFYNNDAFGSFEETRSYGLGGEIKNLQTMDFNNDKFIDLVYLKQGNLEILLGDSVSSFSKKKIVDAGQVIKKFSVLDYNGDGYNDIAYVDISSTKLCIMFAKSDYSFYDPIEYVRSTNLSDISSYVDRGGRKLAALSSDGFIYVISKILLQDEKINIAAFGNPTTIRSFDYNKDNFKELAFIDSESNELKIGLSERRNLFQTFFYIKLATNSDQLFIDDSKQSITTFIAYKSGSREIEIIQYNFENNKRKKHIIYVDQPIKEVKYSSDRLKNRIRICALTINKNVLGLHEFEIRESKVFEIGKWQIASNVEDATFTYGIYKEVFALIKHSSNLDIVKIEYDKKEIRRSPRLTFQLKENEVVHTKMLSVDEFVYGSKSAAVLLSMNNKSVIYYFHDEKNSRVELKEKLAKSMIFKYNIADEKVAFFISSGLNNKIYKTAPFFSNVKIFAQVEAERINDYYITTLIGKNEHLIYTSSNSNSITIKKIL